MADWPTITSLATAAGTLVLALATFASVRSANRAARAAERSLLAGLRPVLMPSRLQDPPQKVMFGDDHWVSVSGGGGSVELTDQTIYLAMSLRNAGSGIAVLHGWVFHPERPAGGDDHAPVDSFRRLVRDIFVPAGDVGFWQGAFREPADDDFATAAAAVAEGEALTLELLYSDHEGGQRTISRFTLQPRDEGHWLASVSRHWNLDTPAPR